MSTLEEMIKNYETVKRGNCRDCGNPWWFSMEDVYVCTTCAKTHGRDSSDVYVPKKENSDQPEASKISVFRGHEWVFSAKVLSPEDSEKVKTEIRLQHARTVLGKK